MLSKDLAFAIIDHIVLVPFNKEINNLNEGERMMVRITTRVYCHGYGPWKTDSLFPLESNYTRILSQRQP
jgi:hypothetical protein